MMVSSSLIFDIFWYVDHMFERNDFYMQQVLLFSVCMNLVCSGYHLTWGQMISWQDIISHHLQRLYPSNIYQSKHQHFTAIFFSRAITTWNCFADEIVVIPDNPIFAVQSPYTSPNCLCPSRMSLNAICINIVHIFVFVFQGYVLFLPTRFFTFNVPSRLKEGTNEWK